MFELVRAGGKYLGSSCQGIKKYILIFFRLAALYSDFHMESSKKPGKLFPDLTELLEKSSQKRILLLAFHRCLVLLFPGPSPAWVCFKCKQEMSIQPLGGSFLQCLLLLVFWDFRAFKFQNGPGLSH